ncbi:hypothetical protein CLAFUW4_06691 [Fulvia fulva]|uniref:Uncharacterized protein n=1 Tax=Passalora fulva TaxID=5499 RepID=A0A9Q8PBJ4_PASFU|nr:uncharacterized protein CLAFUR5_06834 [Fulvia fulva]KAK4622256.1 hypothetical protein CLAFUR4_06699 [Fulvia fulva]KAK4622975.1 hypothetical protein CLAFUR0_06693 [Fulvia fulva]UJO19446.1 hypothetical protein CLAFUR5_06834 [Fulvia fulva]WPV15866.1 hypothetical protein CLAFUW4_06691 [Fulvia fulva]WPV30712.1 hypothetical protein CLAFUW7_06690 [Fulvia fulva]
MAAARVFDTPELLEQILLEVAAQSQQSNRGLCIGLGLGGVVARQIAFKTIWEWTAGIATTLGEIHDECCSFCAAPREQPVDFRVAYRDRVRAIIRVDEEH